ncbi:coiled-coil domain-containing protein [Rhodopirellula europaea]|uniref:Uncharacterized protein n=1 Tax=Rhodopirellula europaea 6C TaxID=1263867 RepID=M2A3Z3_9BACT|nr:hypothetical protein [Rhodopirellula europaea]EMB14076.1 hypothetical protein RE6C_05160 [Rhodopirellula europaea 6C]
MPLTGPTVHQQLLAAYNQAAVKLEQLRSQLGQFQSEQDSLQNQRDETLRSLAQHYLPELTPEAIQETWSEVRASMSEILLRKQDHERRLHEDLEADTHGREMQEAALSQLNESIAAAETKQEELIAAVEQTLRDNPNFVALSDRAAMAEAALERAEANLDEISQDAARKLPAYEECNLFCYLRDRKFGTPEYAHRGFTRRMDRWIAKLNNYHESKRNYDYLTTTPETMRTIIAEDREALETVMEELERHRDEAAAEHGLDQHLREVRALNRQRDATLKELDEWTQRCEQTEAKLTELETPQCSYYQEAIELFREMLDRTDTHELRQQARRTPEITDDQIVASLRGIETRMDQTELSSNRHQEEMMEQQQIHQAIGRLIQRFRASGYEQARCQFSDMLDVLTPLDRARSAHDVDDLWNSIRRMQSWGPTAMDRVTNVATHPMTQVLVNAMAHAAAGAMSEHARRAGRRTRRRR